MCSARIPIHSTARSPPADIPIEQVAEWTTVNRLAVMNARPFMTVLQFFKFTSMGRWPQMEKRPSKPWGCGSSRPRRPDLGGGLSRPFHRSKVLLDRPHKALGGGTTHPPGNPLVPVVGLGRPLTSCSHPPAFSGKPRTASAVLARCLSGGFEALRGVPVGEDGAPLEPHEPSAAPSLRRRSREMPALAAVRPARPPAVSRLALTALPERGSLDLIPLRRLERVGDRIDELLQRALALEDPHREAFVIALTSSSLVIAVGPSIPMAAASSTSSGLL